MKFVELPSSIDFISFHKTVKYLQHIFCVAICAAFASTFITSTASAKSRGFEWDERQIPEIQIRGKVGNVVSIDLRDGRPDGENRFVIPFSIDVPADAKKVLAGSLLLKNNGRQNIGPALPFKIRVEQPSPDFIPGRLSDPSKDRIVENKNGVLVVGDELILGVSFDASDPDSLAREIVKEFRGEFIGSDTRLNLYQIRFPNADLFYLAEIAKSLKTIKSVEFASLNYVDRDVNTAIPNDTQWGAWDVANPGGNNWGLEWIDAPAAWDETTGSNAIRVAVIDFGNDHTHTDLNDNVSRADVNGSGSHGTHVAGTVCAEGNNNKGVTGVAWDCDLRFFAGGFSVAVTAGRMADAIDDGARIVNMSLNYIENGNCSINESLLEDDVLGQSVIYAQRNDIDVLWALAAGNDCARNAIFTAPGGLGARFPMNTMTVAAIGRDGNLASFSNNGDIVSVAAPGVDILSTEPRTCFLWIFCGDNYGFKNGTSMATPHVAGLAALVMSDDPSRTAAEVKTCIVAGSQREGTAVAGESFNTINAPAAVRCEGIIDLPPEVDIVLALDLTGSMGGVLNQAKMEMVEVATALSAAAPSTNFTFGVVSFEDYPGSFPADCGSSYSSTYGSFGDMPFSLDLALTPDSGTVSGVINSLFLGSGADGPESYARAIWEVAQQDTGMVLGWRPDALRLLIMFGDNVPHDTNLNEGVVGGVFTGDTGIDPGRNSVIDCGGDDIDLQDDALQDASDSGLKLLFVDSSGSSNIEPYWRTWTSLTGGAYARLGDSEPLPDVILELLGLIGG